MTDKHKELIDSALSICAADAAARRENAGYGGRQDDGGCRDLLNQVKAYEQGRAGIFPDFLMPYRDKADNAVKESEARLDPEYAEFQRLKRKFGHD